MEEELKKLEKFVENCKNCNFATCEQCEINSSEVKALQTLIKEYKELKGKLTPTPDNAVPLEYQTMMYVDKRGYVSKEKIKEKLEELQKEYKKISKENFINKTETQKVLCAQIVAYKKLLED